MQQQFNDAQQTLTNVRQQQAKPKRQASPRAATELLSPEHHPQNNSTAATENTPLSLADGISQKQLADRLGVSVQSVQVNEKKGADHFAAWCREGSDRPQSPRNPDPDGLAWERRSNGLFYPLVEEGSESNLAEDDA